MEKQVIQGRRRSNRELSKVSEKGEGEQYRTYGYNVTPNLLLFQTGCCRNSKCTAIQIIRKPDMILHFIFLAQLIFIADHSSMEKLLRFV